MVYIDVSQDGSLITLNCHKRTEDGEFFQLLIDAKTMQVLKRPENPDIDVSVAYSHIYALMRNGEQLPSHTVACWG